jgi:hypothetical protein
MAHQTPKEQYESSLQAILQIVMDMPQLSDGDWKAISDHTGKLWGMRDRLNAVQQQVTIIERNRYYRERVLQTPRTMMLTAQEKATSDLYTHCQCCKRIVKKNQLISHQNNTKVCLDIRLALEMEKRYLNSKVAWKRKIHNFFEEHRKTYQMIHYFIKKRSEDIPNPEGKGVYDYYQ